MHAEHADKSELSRLSGARDRLRIHSTQYAWGGIRADAHRMPCTNELKATGLRLCLLLNFGKSLLGIKTCGT